MAEPDFQEKFILSQKLEKCAKNEPKQVFEFIEKFGH